MNNPFDYIPDAACDEAFGRLKSMLDRLRQSDSPRDLRFCRELDEGKMLGVLIAEAADGKRHTLYAFSGQIGDAGFHQPGFVEPVFDYLQPDGHFKTKEAEICRLTEDIISFENGDFARLSDDYSQVEKQVNTALAQYKEHCRRSKLERDQKRASAISEDEERELIRQSQFEKAELRRMKQKSAAELEPIAKKLKTAENHLRTLKERRRSESEALQQWLFSNFIVLNARGEKKSLSEIFADTSMKVPPSGAGECCAPKLLQAAYIRGLKPVSIAEYWYGKPKGGEVRIHGSYYPACRGKCFPILSWMLQGLYITPPLNPNCDKSVLAEPEIVYECDRFCVVNKPSGMLTVPGKGNALSLQQWLAEKYGERAEVKMAHRLDRDTSGLVIAAFDAETYKLLQSLFASRKVKKTYIADLEGDYDALGIPAEGRIELPLSPDWLDRPRQKVDVSDGKSAITEYRFISRSDSSSRVTFSPLTGRTHQLRVHAASAFGLGMPIVGDCLYGKRCDAHPDRLHLHAYRLEFTFPADGKTYSFEAPVPF